MNLHDLASHARDGHIDELNLISLEGGIYLLDAHMGGRVLPLLDGHGQTLQLRSVEHARELLQELPSVPLFLLHDSVHDEMCGLPSADNRLKVPLAWHSPW